MKYAAEISRCQRWVVKIGSSLLTNDGKGLAVDAIDDWVAQIAGLRKDGREVLLVVSVYAVLLVLLSLPFLLWNWPPRGGWWAYPYNVWPLV